MNAIAITMTCFILALLALGAYAIYSYFDTRKSMADFCQHFIELDAQGFIPPATNKGYIDRDQDEVRYFLQHAVNTGHLDRGVANRALAACQSISRRWHEWYGEDAGEK